MRVLLVGIVVLGVQQPTSQVALGHDRSWAQRAVEDRQAFGLAVDDRALAELQGGADVGAVRWGIPLTAAEEAALDLNGRMAFESDLEASLLPYVRSLSGFAGVWIDQRNGGRAVVLLTDLDPEVERQIRSRLPAASRGLLIVRAERTYDQLRLASQQARQVAAGTVPALSIATVSVDVPANGLRVGVAGWLEDPARLAAEATVSGVLGVHVSLFTVVVGSDVACLTRENCHSPMKPGILIHRGSNTSDWYCTSSWHIHVGTDEQFLTAGHCGYFTPNSWYHPGFVLGVPTGFVGLEMGTLYADGGKDAMRVAILDSQATGDVYGQSDTGSLGSASLPMVGEVVCASLGKSNVIDCGTVSADWTTWVSEIANFDVWGGDTTGIAPIKGDSGSPLYKRVVVGDDITLYPKGIIDHEDGQFARITDVLSAFGATIVQ